MEFQSRLKQLRGQLVEVADMAYIPPSADLQYLTGIPRSMPNFGNLIHPGDWLEGLWLIPNREPTLILTRMSMEFGGQAEVAHLNVYQLEDHEDPSIVFEEIVAKLGNRDSVRIAIGGPVRPETIRAFQESLAECTYFPVGDMLMPMRMMKSQQEINAMQRAGEMTEAAFKALLPTLRHGMSELDVLQEVEFQLRRQGSLGSSFEPVLYCSGPNHELIFGKPELTQNRTLDPPVSLLFDFGAIHQGYCYDFGRTIFFGQPDEEMVRIHQLVMESQRAGIQALCADGASAAQADAAARSVIEDGGCGEMFRHRLGHGIGLDVHEPPFLTEGDLSLLRTGMLFTVEPSITQFTDFSARVEDVVLVGEKGGTALTSGFQDLIVV
jgi:Xaa-Pro aminopeptidase